MKIAILSRNQNLYSIRRLQFEANEAGIECDVINPLFCQLVLDGKKSRIQYEGQTLSTYDAILPRIGASITEYGLSVVQHFEMLGIPCMNGSKGISESRNKLRSLQLLTQAGLSVPSTVLTRTTHEIHAAVAAAKGLPVVLKTLQGTQGVGVMLIHTPVSLGSVLDTLRKLNQDALIQQFIVEGGGSDYRILVIGGKIIASMKRTAAEGEFRSNVHRGAESQCVHLPKKYQQLAIKAAKILQLQIAGVDIIASRKGPMVIEVNSSPGFEGLEKATEINIAQAMIRHVEKTIEAL